MARELKNHPGFYLNDAAAADFDRLEDNEGVFTVNSARRSVQEQQGLIDLYHSPNRPAWLFKPYEPAKDGPHVKDDGKAVDIAEWLYFLKICKKYNFTQPYSWDYVHFEHNGDRTTLESENKTTPEKKRKHKMDEHILLVLQSKNTEFDQNMVLVNLKTGEMVNLGNSPHSAVRAYYANNFPWQGISDAEWADKFTEEKGFNYIRAV